MTTAALGRRESLINRVRELPDSAVESVIEFIDDVAKARRNAEYMAMIDRSIKDLEEGRGIVKTMEELEAMAN
ncbi:hypothetical protein FACS1894187_21250 [Synergistales bacterium]|nr:hypothetical protein FACS1894187_21250 [Synergistales bacterium]